MSRKGRPVVAITQGDPAGVGPEVAVRAAARQAQTHALVVAEKVALEAVRGALSEEVWSKIEWVSTPPPRDAWEQVDAERLIVWDPVGLDRKVTPGQSGEGDARGALTALDRALDLALDDQVDAVVTAPVSKESIAGTVAPEFRGHTDHLAQRCGLSRYGSEYLMAFLTEDLQVALLSTHEPLGAAIEHLSTPAVVSALQCLHRHAGGRIALAGLNPHAGEGGLLGGEDRAVLEPAVALARAEGVDVHGPLSADSVFARCRQGEFDWVLALYHDQGLIAVKTAAFGAAVNWTLGLPVLRTSVDHGTAFELAGTGRASASPMGFVLRATADLVRGELPRRS